MKRKSVKSEGKEEASPDVLKEKSKSKKRKYIKVEFDEDHRVKMKGKIERAHGLLGSMYGIPQKLSEATNTNACNKKDTICEAVVSLMLSQNTSDRNSSRAWASLRKKFSTLDEIRNASVESIEEAIKKGGLAKRKSKMIKEFLNDVHSKYGETSLEFLYTKETEEIKKILLSFKGVGPKTCACMMLFTMDRPEFAVDTHVHRVSNRLGWVNTGSNREKTFEIMNKLVPDELKHDMHVLMIRHGRRTCSAQNPKCSACKLTNDCLYFASSKEEKSESDKELDF